MIAPSWPMWMVVPAALAVALIAFVVCSVVLMDRAEDRKDRRDDEWARRKREADRMMRERQERGAA